MTIEIPFHYKYGKFARGRCILLDQDLDLYTLMIVNEAVNSIPRVTCVYNCLDFIHPTPTSTRIREAEKATHTPSNRKSNYT